MTPVIYQLRRPGGVVIYQVVGTLESGVPQLHFTEATRPRGLVEMWRKIGDGVPEKIFAADWGES